VTTVTKLDVGRRMAEIRKALDECERRCALAGWPDARRQLLVEGADFRDLLAGGYSRFANHEGREVTR
jgi:hypothetical protein